MIRLFLLSERQMARISPYFPKSTASARRLAREASIDLQMPRRLSRGFIEFREKLTVLAPM